MKTFLTGSLGYALTAFVSVLLTLISMMIMVTICSCVPCIIKSGEQKIVRNMLVKLTNFVPVQSQEDVNSENSDSEV